MTVIGVTGSYGKTSVKYYLDTLLRVKYQVLITPESFNTPMGVVRTIRENMKNTDEIFICEMADSISRLAVDQLHIIGDIFDRGAHPDSIFD